MKSVGFQGNLSRVITPSLVPTEVPHPVSLMRRLVWHGQSGSHSFVVSCEKSLNSPGSTLSAK